MKTKATSLVLRVVTLALVLVSVSVFYACGGGDSENSEEPAVTDETAVKDETSSAGPLKLQLKEVTAVTTPTNNVTPSYVFSSSKAGRIDYSGGCRSDTSSAVAGNNSIKLKPLSEGRYEDCAVTVTDAEGQKSEALIMSAFVVDLTASTLKEVQAIASPTIDETPEVTISSTEPGQIEYGGSCSSLLSTVKSGENRIVLKELQTGTYSDCTVTVTDHAGNQVTLNLAQFTVNRTIQWGSATDDLGQSVASDSKGNIFVSSVVTSGIGDGKHYGQEDLHLVKFDSGGTRLWSRQFGTAGRERNLHVATDSEGAVYVTGSTTVSLDGVLTHYGNMDLFLLKYSADGVLAWKAQIGSNSKDFPGGIAVSSEGDVYVVGRTAGVFDGNTQLQFRDVFLVKYRSTGEKLWSRQVGSMGEDAPGGIAIDSEGGIYIAGSANGSVNSNAHRGNYDLFLMKYMPDGTLDWSRQRGTSGEDYARGLALDAKNNVYVLGDTAASFDGETYSGGMDIVIIKYERRGTKRWTKQVGAPGSDLARGIVVDSLNQIFLTGVTNRQLGKEHFGLDDFFIVKYQIDFAQDLTEQKWIYQAGTTKHEGTSGITVCTSNRVYVTGQTKGALDGNLNLGGDDVFLHRLPAGFSP